MSRYANESLAGLASPPNNVDAFHRAAPLVVINLIPCALRIARIRIDKVTLRPARQSDAGIGGIADREDHRVHLKVRGSLRAFASHAVIAFHENVLSHP